MNIIEHLSVNYADKDDLPGLNGGPRRVAEMAFEAGFRACRRLLFDSVVDIDFAADSKFKSLPNFGEEE